MDLDKLRLRLADLGVDVSSCTGGVGQQQQHQGTSPGRKTRASQPGPPDLVDEHDDVLDVLERCHRVEASFMDGRPRPSTSSSPQPGEVDKRGDAKRGRKRVVKFDGGGKGTNSTTGMNSTTVTTSAGCGLRTGQRLASRCKNIHTPLGSVLAQYKEAEEHWAREKAIVRRDAFFQRKRARRLDLENRRLAAVNHHKTLDIKALKNALASRDAQLQALQKKSTELETLLSDNHEKVAQEIIELKSERDELRSLLNATLKRLEAVDEFVYRTAMSSSKMEDKLRRIEAERLQAMDEASKSQGLKKELNGTKKQLNLQKEIVKKMSEIQLRKNRKQQNAIRAVLDGSAAEKNPMSIATAMSESNTSHGGQDEKKNMIRDSRDELPPAIQSMLGG